MSENGACACDAGSASPVSTASPFLYAIGQIEARPLLAAREQCYLVRAMCSKRPGH